MRAETLVPAGLLMGASALFLPVIYSLVDRDTAPPLVGVCLGLLCMGLAWCAGNALERRRRPFVFALAAVGTLAGLGARFEPLTRHLDGWAAPFLAASAMLSLAALGFAWANREALAS